MFMKTIKDILYEMFSVDAIKVAALSECDDDTISWLLGISYDLTRSKIKRK